MEESGVGSYGSCKASWATEVGLKPKNRVKRRRGSDGSEQSRADIPMENVASSIPRYHNPSEMVSRGF